MIPFHPSPLASLVLVVFLLNPSLALADDGHSHGEAPAVASGPALPRFAAVSESFELVGVAQGRQLTLYLDHTADNQPVKGATLDLEVGGQKLKATPHGDGEFEATLAADLEHGVVPVVASVATPSASDLLAGEFDIHEDAHADAASTGRSAKTLALWGAGGVAAIAVLAFLARATRRAPRTGAAA